MEIAFLAAVINTIAVALKLEWASESPGGLVKTLIVISCPQSFCFNRSGMRLENLQL